MAFARKTLPASGASAASQLSPDQSPLETSMKAAIAREPAPYPLLCNEAVARAPFLETGSHLIYEQTNVFY